MQKNVLIYCRESRDENFSNYERIETQRDILINYCTMKNLGNIIDIIMDDNKSGTDFERLEPVKNYITNGKVNILLLKDASRLGRNVLESLNFVSFLEKYKIQLIFESEQYDEDIFPLIAWFNERRAKEDSLKIRRVLKHKMELGEIIIKAPYGYIKQDNKLVIDEKAAVVIREIFNMYVNGMDKQEIIDVLNINQYPTPSQLKTQYINTNMTTVWNKQHINRILNHIIYIGDMPYGMRKKANFKSKKYEYIDKKDWIIVPDHHEPIISKEMFDLAQSLSKKYNKQDTKVSSPKGLFSGLLFCGYCGSVMYRKLQHGKSPWYSCSKSKKYCKSSHYIRECVLIQIIKSYIKKLAEQYITKDELVALIGNELESIQQLKNIEVDISNIKNKLSMVYDDKLNGLLPKFLAIQKIESLTQELKSKEDILYAIKEQLKNDNKEDLFENFIEELQLKAISNKSLNMLFSKILVFREEDMTRDKIDMYNISYEKYQEIQNNRVVIFIQKFAFYLDIL